MKSVMDDTGNVSPSGIPGLASVSLYRILVFRACVLLLCFTFIYELLCLFCNEI